jgi:hypothetical protein
LSLAGLCSPAISEVVDGVRFDETRLAKARSETTEAAETTKIIMRQYPSNAGQLVAYGNTANPLLKGYL